MMAGLVLFTGLKIVGGQALASGYVGAFITYVKPGSLADVVGQLKAGECYCLRYNKVLNVGQGY